MSGLDEGALFVAGGLICALVSLLVGLGAAALVWWRRRSVGAAVAAAAAIIAPGLLVLVALSLVAHTRAPPSAPPAPIPTVAPPSAPRTDLLTVQPDGSFQKSDVLRHIYGDDSGTWIVQKTTAEREGGAVELTGRIENIRVYSVETVRSRGQDARIALTTGYHTVDGRMYDDGVIGALLAVPEGAGWRVAEVHPVLVAGEFGEGVEFQRIALDPDNDGLVLTEIADGGEIAELALFVVSLGPEGKPVRYVDEGEIAICDEEGCQGHGMELVSRPGPGGAPEIYRRSWSQQGESPREYSSEQRLLWVGGRLVPDPASAQASDPPRLTNLPEELRGSLQAVQAHLAQVATAADFRAAWLEADAAAIPLEAALNAWGGRPVPCHELDLEGLNADLQVMSVECVGAAMDPSLRLPADPWRAAAARTPEASDDAFVALVSAIYEGRARANGSPVWFQAMSDAGGCSRLGQGSAVVEPLLLADKAVATGDLFPEQVGALREAALDNIIGEGQHYCTEGKPTPDAQIVAEAQRVLTEVKLSDEERSAVEAALPKLRGQAYSGE